MPEGINNALEVGGYALPFIGCVQELGFLVTFCKGKPPQDLHIV